MLSDLLEVGERLFLSSHDGGHTAESSTLELFAAVQAVTELEETNIVFTDAIDEMLAGVDLAQSELVVILIVEHIQQTCQERMQVVENWELVQYLLQLFAECFLGEFYFAHIAARGARVAEQSAQGRAGEAQYEAPDTHKLRILLILKPLWI